MPAHTPAPFAPGLPTGTVTFMFTDIEGSTKLWEQHPQQMRDALARHDALLRQAIESNGGHVFKTVGDAFCAAFPTAIDALSAALDAHRALQAEAWGETGPLKIRVGLHTGMAQERDGDYFGPALNRVARLQAAGHGGQTLLSTATQELVRDYLPPGVELENLGEHRLKDLIRPEHIFQLVTQGLASEFPPLKTLDTQPNNLPRLTTPLVGRAKEVEAVLAMLHRPNVALVTLTGPGGTGKTRLALQAGAEALDDFPDGVWFVELAALTEPNLVASTIAQALHVTEAPGKPLVDTLKEYLKEKWLLLILDNFEQLMEASGVVTAIVKAAPHVKVLTTSRVKLNIYGEHEYAVPPLSLPDVRQGHLPPIERLTQYEAVRLFIERAQASRADFEVTNENAPAVAEICVRLDGLPLAIELAAARIKMLPPQALLTRLSSRLKLLTGGSRDLPARQQTLRGAIEWSYDLLNEGEKQLFRRMAVFQGGRTLEGLEAVCNSEALQVYGQLEIEVFDGAQSLLDKSLLGQREGSNDEPRFWMLETIHEYAREKLEESGEAAALQREHALYFMLMAEEAEPHLTGAQQQEWLERLEDEHDNIRAALRWAIESEEPEKVEMGLRIAGAIWRFWLVRGYISEGREELSGLLERAEAEVTRIAVEGLEARRLGAYRAKALSAAGNLTSMQGDYASARSLLEKSLHLYEEIGDKYGITYLLNSLANKALEQGDYASARLQLEESLHLCREIGDKHGIADALSTLANMAARHGDYTSARSLYGEGLALLREFGNKRNIALSLSCLGYVALQQGEYVSARSLLEEGLALQREIGDKYQSAYTLSSLGSVALQQEEYAAARSLYEESLALQGEFGDKYGIAYSLSSLGSVALQQEEYAAARSLYEESLALQREIGNKQGIATSLAGLGGLAVAVGRGDRADSVSQVENSGRTGSNTPDETGRGVRLLGAGEVLLESMGAVLDATEELAYERAVASARAQLGEEEFERLRQEGQDMSMEQAIEYALGNVVT
jgi:predicted ATPase/class 3 adenylate cyclase/Tfp pilus assembly protein PilF